eukprot:3048139-Rhodomonas_salina.1
MAMKMSMVTMVSMVSMPFSVTSDVVAEYTATARREDFDATTFYSKKNPKSLKTLSAALASIRYQKER